MNREQLGRLRTVTAEVSAWAERAGSIQSDRDSVDREAESALVRLRDAAVEVAVRDRVHWRVIPLIGPHARDLTALARHEAKPRLDGDSVAALDRLTGEVPAALRAARAAGGLRRFFSSAEAKRGADAAAEFVSEFHAWGNAWGIEPRLAELDIGDAVGLPVVTSDALEAHVGLTAALRPWGVPSLVQPSAVAGLPQAVWIVLEAVDVAKRCKADAEEQGAAMRRADAELLLHEMPLERLREAASGSIRVQPLADAGYRSVLDVLRYATRLTAVPGIGATTAARIRAAAQTLQAATQSEVVVRLDATDRTAASTELLRRLSTWDAARRRVGSALDADRAHGLAALADRLTGGEEQLVVFPVGADLDAFGHATASVRARASEISATPHRGGSADPWADFVSRPSDYIAMLDEIGLVTERDDVVGGDLPDDVIEAVRGFALDTEYLTASLRGYQSFAAKFALVQRKVVIGDEMGLGKTIEALAVLAHARSRGGMHSLVVCPAAVVTNWVREVSAKSTLEPHRLHGAGRGPALRAWLQRGGVAVTTYESLGWLQPHLAQLTVLACAVVDEAHYVKNPSAQRSSRTAAIVGAAERAVLLTGTPLENRVAEFRNLVRYVRPELVVDGTDLRPRLFRKQIAPVYLRRSQEDVLSELPELVEVDEWTPMSAADETAYSTAVASGNFHDMRRAPLLQGAASGKIQRLIEIVEEAEENGRKVLVFSNYLDVLAQVAGVLPGQVFGPLTGSIPANQRQDLVDRFTAAPGGAVLISQIQAGGVGLNVQAASVVVICEPQVKPTTEWQAIARAHRMGQLQTVQVHRLLSDVGADQRLVQVLRAKSALFAEFAAISETADAAPDALDVTDAAMVKQIVREEQQRLFGAITVAI